MDWPAALSLSAGLAMDAVAVSVATGVVATRVRVRDAIAVAVIFGGIHAITPTLGWLVGSRFGSSVHSWEHWIAFVLLGGIGVKMLWDARKAHDEPEAAPKQPFALKVLLVLGVATGIDAVAAGISLPMLGLPLWPSVAVIGVVTGVLSVAGLFIGYRFRFLLGRSLDVLGGLVLLGLAVKALVVGLR